MLLLHARVERPVVGHVAGLSRQRARHASWTSVVRGRIGWLAGWHWCVHASPRISALTSTLWFDPMTQVIKHREVYALPHVLHRSLGIRWENYTRILHALQSRCRFVRSKNTNFTPRNFLFMDSDSLGHTIFYFVCRMRRQSAADSTSRSVCRW